MHFDLTRDEALVDRLSCQQGKQNRTRQAASQTLGSWHSFISALALQSQAAIIGRSSFRALRAQHTAFEIADELRVRNLNLLERMFQA
ncbi:hypothetical protein CBOM_07876 [Ceraceosorus bombacis]|uniref:Uncharacterized protein n=1 Tax=Ceraceosorus bombacis TaxID=401625 RepID=A0A0P1BHQ9_9BASI|nr:hypothetical protein CBOM_07876 [Ceraceosorus bombacis]